MINTNLEKLPRKLTTFLWYFIHRYKLDVFGLVLIAVLVAANTSLAPYLLKTIIDEVVSHSDNLENLKSAVLFPAILYVTLYFSVGVFLRIHDLLVLRLIPNIKRDIQEKMLSYLEGHSHTYFQNNFAGSLSNKVSDMMRAVPEIILITTDYWIITNLAVIFAAITMYFVRPEFGIIIAIWAVIYYVVMWQLSKKNQKYVEIFSESRSALMGKQVDSISNMSNVRLFSRKKYEINYIKNSCDDMVKKDRNMQMYITKVHIFQFISMTIVVALTMFFLIDARSKDLITIGEFVMVLALSIRVIEMIWNSANQLIRFSSEVGTCKQALNVISRDHEIKDAQDAENLHIHKGEIIFDNVSFSHQHNDELFKNKNLKIEAGSKVGLVGFSGSGKSTFVNLILRLFDLDAGRILIDGQDISKVTQDSLREQISIIPQDTSLFHRSLMENIRYGNLAASDEEVIKASKRAHCHEFISKLPEGYDSMVGERGIKLSGGQRQRIAIARAILKNSPILILDEATSSLDSITEKHIQESLHDLMADKTTLIIAHRLSTLAKMDRILVFHNGKIVEDGTLKELLKQGGHYAKMWKMQSDGFLPDDTKDETI